MKKNIIFILIFCFLNTIFSEQVVITDDGKKVVLKDNKTWEYVVEKENTENFDFRKAHWGLGKARVKKIENEEIIQEDDNLIAYEGSVLGLDCYIVYIFAQNKLVRAKYVFINKHSNKNDFIDDYATIKNALIKKYDKPSADEVYWKNNLYKDDVEGWGMAVSAGHLVYYSSWESGSTQVFSSLTGENYDISLQIEYSSIKLKELEENEKDSKNQADL